MKKCFSYGDLSPRSKLARTISMVWFLVGLILNGIVVGFITTALTSIDQPERYSLYNTKVRQLGRVKDKKEHYYPKIRLRIFI